MSTITPSLVDVYYHGIPSARGTGVLRIFVNGFGRDAPFQEQPPGSGHITVKIDALELAVEHLGAIRSALCAEELKLAEDRQHNDHGLTESAAKPGHGYGGTLILNALIGRDTTVEFIEYRTKSVLASGIIRMHAGISATDLPCHEHVSRNGRFVLQLHRVELDLRLLAAIGDALQKAEDDLHQMRNRSSQASSSPPLKTDDTEERTA